MNKSNTWETKLLFLVFFLIVVFNLLYVSFRTQTAENNDFENIYTGASIYRFYGGDRLYDEMLQREIQLSKTTSSNEEKLLAYRSLPFVALIYSPLAGFDYEYAYAFSALLNIICLIASVYLLSKELKLELYELPLILLSLLYYIVIFQFNQNAFPAFFFIVFSYVLLRKEKNFLSGLFITLALIKTHYILIFPFLLLLVKNKKRFLSGSFLGFSLLYVLNFIVYGGEFVFSYLNFVLNSETVRFGTLPFSNTNLITVLFRTFPNMEHFSPIFLTINAAVFLLALFIVRRIGNNYLGFATACAFTTLLNLHTLWVDLFLLLPLHLIFISDMRMARKRLFFAILFALLVFAYTGSIFKHITPEIGSFVDICFLVFVFMYPLLRDSITDIQESKLTNKEEVIHYAET